MNHRRQFLRRAGAACTLALLPSTAVRDAVAQATPKAAPITMVINQSPWFDGFRQLVEQYRKETGNAIELEQMGRFALKGLQQQVAAYRVLRGAPPPPAKSGGPTTSAEQSRRAQRPA